MNEFTKEELEHILWVFNQSYEFNDRLMDDIRVKLKVMIKDYCEHEMLESASNPRCVKCGVYP
jgi:hypothetical protein